MYYRRGGYAGRGGCDVFAILALRVFDKFFIRKKKKKDNRFFFVAKNNVRDKRPFYFTRREFSSPYYCR